MLLTRAVVLGLSLVTQSLLAYALMPAGRGAYAVCVLFGDVSGIVVTLGSGRGAQYFVMTKRLSVSQGISVAFAFCLVGSLVAAVVAAPLIHSELDFFRNADISSFRLAVVLIFTSSLTFATATQMEGLRRFGQLAWFSFLRAVVVVVAIVIFVWVLDLGVNGALLAVALGHVTMIGACLGHLRRRYGLVLETPTRKGVAAVLRYGLKDYPAAVGESLEARLGSLLLGVAASRAEIGLFAAGNALVTRFLTFPAAVAVYLLPRVAGDSGQRPELAAFCARISWWIVGGVVLVWLAVSTHLVPLLLSDAFAPVVHLTWIMSIGALAHAGTEIFTAYLRGTNRPQIFSLAMWLGLFANVLLFFALYPAFGLHGAAWALTGGLACRSLALRVAFQRITGLPLSATLALRRDDVAYLWTSAKSLARSAGMRRARGVGGGPNT